MNLLNLLIAILHFMELNLLTVYYVLTMNLLKIYLIMRRKSIQESALSKDPLLLFNTKKAFMELNRTIMLKEIAENLWALITSNEWLKRPAALNTFYLTAFADVKNFSYYFWNCIPALLFPENIHQTTQFESPNMELHALAYEFLIKNNGNAFLLTNDYLTLKLDKLIEQTSPEDFLLVFPNPSELEEKYGWSLRNLLAAIAFLKPQWSNLRVYSLTRIYQYSFIASLSWDKVKLGIIPKCVGWERTSSDKLTFRSVDLKFMLDPINIMEQSVDLNLKLIRWRQAPNISLANFTSLRVLLIGAGTLGCNIARGLLGWGVRNFTFIDYATVSYNNPVRQSLFCFNDCLVSGLSKAEAAANSLRLIYPKVEAKGIHMKVPMPGYPFSEEEEENVKYQCKQLEDCIKDCDVLFLVMDSRESRWLPTLLASVHNKLAITVALGFDDFVILRHGTNNSENQQNEFNKELEISELLKDLPTELPGSLLGCYFCNDVTAPGNSTSERALDQHCTISRAGISMIASGFAVELLASILQHKLGADAPARMGEINASSSLLGATPHEIRGFVSSFQQIMPTIRRFDRCTACGYSVRQLYCQEGFKFLSKIFNDPTELERVSGLTELQRQANDFQTQMIELDDNESISSI
ncbi:Ubiquitin-like modifier-activating enzyme ATG7 [Meloidogyne graminicola]|uniref:Ubiquitin-like modifier-activating enzyme ATG7 n=1 Tax=Meloidogyne graminicola TaxID=189291 RepID=A0A8S9Z6J2_9BILA|nr:Ubiquitin-like modifier-activating enzyme ATG7 [Meloidogyne graminicola]